jgi:hypothetical protein
MVEYQVGVSDPFEKPIHVARNESTLDIIEDQVGANALIKEPIHVVINKWVTF